MPVTEGTPEIQDPQHTPHSGVRTRIRDSVQEDGSRDPSLDRGTDTTYINDLIFAYGALAQNVVESDHVAFMVDAHKQEALPRELPYVLPKIYNVLRNFDAKDVAQKVDAVGHFEAIIAQFPPEWKVQIRNFLAHKTALEHSQLRAFMDLLIGFELQLAKVERWQSGFCESIGFDAPVMPLWTNKPSTVEESN